MASATVVDGLGLSLDSKLLQVSAIPPEDIKPRRYKFQA